MLVLFVIVLEYFQYTDGSYITYTNGQMESYDNAEHFCNSSGGHMLSYGMEMIQALTKCFQREDIIWVGKPWILSRGCFNLTDDSAKQIGRRPNGTNSFECFSWCNINYPRLMFVGIQTDKCMCITELNPIMKHRKGCVRNCPGLRNEKCGENNHSFIYEKVMSLKATDNKTICRQTLLHNGYNSVLNADADKSPHYLGCYLVTGNPAYPPVINCSSITRLPTFTPTTDPVSPKIFLSDQSTEGTCKSLINEDNGVIDDTTFNIALIASIVVSCLVITVFVCVVICLQRKSKKRVNNKASNQTQPLASKSNYEEPDDLVEVEMNQDYDHTCHELRRHSNTGGNIYDHTNTVEGTYNTAVIGRQQGKDVEFTDTSSTSAAAHLGEYETCAIVAASSKTAQYSKKKTNGVSESLEDSHYYDEKNVDVDKS